MRTAWKWGGWTILQAGLMVCLAAGAWAGDRAMYGSDDSAPRTLQPVIDDSSFAMADQDPAPPVPPDAKAAPGAHSEKAPAKKAAGAVTSGDGCLACEQGCDSCANGRGRWFDIDECEPCGPYWTATTGAMVLHRSTSRDYVVGDGPFKSGELRPGWSTGPRIEIARHYQKWDLDFVYWGLDSWNDELSARTQLLPPLRESASYGSRLYNWEWNLKRKFEGISLLAGMRYMELQEKLYGEEDGLLLRSFEERRTANYLYGFQFGAEADIAHCDRFGLDGFAKFGTFTNHVHESAAIGNQFISIGRDATRTETALLAELGLNATAQLTKHISAYAGYEVMWIDGVVLAPDTLAAVRLTEARTNTPFYHGANFGLEFRF